MTSDADIQAVVLVRAAGPDPAHLDRLLRCTRGVTAAWHLAGDADLLVLVTCRDLPDLRRIVTRLRAGGRAVVTDTHLVLRRVVFSSRTLPGA